MLTASGLPIKNGHEVEALLEAWQLPIKLAVVKCEANSSSSDKIAIGNRQADKEAKATALVREGDKEPHANIVNTKAGIISERMEATNQQEINVGVVKIWLPSRQGV